MKDGSILRISVEDKTRTLHIVPDTNGGMNTYYLDSDNSLIKIKVMCLKDYVTQKLDIPLLEQKR